MIDDQRLQELGVFTPEGKLTIGYGQHYLFLVGRDDIHGILHYLINNETLELDGNEFGYDDQELNDDILALFKKPSIKVQITLDKTQAGGAHEKQIIAADKAQDPVEFSNSFAIGNSATHQISHTKGMIFVGQGIWVEGSTNLSTSGEGTGISLKADVANPKGWKAQNNTLVVSVNPVGLSRFKAKLDAEHQIAKAQYSNSLLKGVL
jgi:hypothetical protein